MQITNQNTTITRLKQGWPINVCFRIGLLMKSLVFAIHSGVVLFQDLAQTEEVVDACQLPKLIVGLSCSWLFPLCSADCRGILCPLF